MSTPTERWFFLNADAADRALARGIDLRQSVSSAQTPMGDAAFDVHVAAEELGKQGPMPAVSRVFSAGAELECAISVLADAERKVFLAIVFWTSERTRFIDGAAFGLGGVERVSPSDKNNRFAQVAHCVAGSPITQIAIQELADAIAKNPDLLARARSRWLVEREAQALRHEVAKSELNLAPNPRKNPSQRL